RRRAIVDSRGIACSDGTVPLERRLQGGELLDRRARTGVLVRIDDDWIALLPRHRNGNDFVLELEVRYRADGALLALGRERVLIRARDGVARRDLLRGDAHMALLHRAREALE